MSRKFWLALSAATVTGLVTSPAGAQRMSHGAGVSWSGTHGGVSWDGGHAYEGGSYGGYPAASPPRPAYQMPQPSPYRPQVPVARHPAEHRFDERLALDPPRR